MNQKNSTYDKFLDKINSFDGIPKVIEALWDGDTTGWFLVMYVIFEKKKLLTKYTSREQIGVIRKGSDIRLLQSKVPPYPESEIANRIGKYFHELYETEFYFPSPIHPDDDCPSYYERNRGISCADCNKLIIPTTSPHLPKDICYNCHLSRERNKKIEKEEPYDKGIHIYLINNGQFQNLGYYGDLKYLPIGPFISKIVEIRKTKDPISIVTLSTEDLSQLKIQLENELDKITLEHKDPPSHIKSKFIQIKFVKYKSKQFKTMTRFNSEHEKLSNLISSYDQLNKALDEESNYVIYFKNGITTRDDSILRYIKYIGKGKSTFSQLEERYLNIIDTDVIRKSVQKLEKYGCLSINTDVIEITQNGKNII